MDWLKDFAEWLGDNAWASWLGIGGLLTIGELFSLDLVLIMLAAGAGIGMVVALLGGPLWLQVVLAAVTSLAALALLRPGIRKRLHSGPDLQIGHDRLVGRQATALSSISALHPGLVKLAGEEWSAQPYDETIVIEPGQIVDVLEIRGATAIVHPLPQIE
ncbi:NfeD family protein [Nocardioides alcanivorans]|uniref:NfeD family protein n=1 Tax=Nocardioides alcanivorans TaxID=2897352 RepID=UPI001F261FD3|nr:NfeD family protein [Nocardioides alcanivorans]